MSFSNQIKTELCEVGLLQPCCMVAECMGVLLFAKQFSVDKLRVQSGNEAMRRRVKELFTRVFGVAPNCEEGSRNTLFVTDRAQLERLYRTLGYQYRNVPLHLNRALVEEDCCKGAFLRGAFLTGGYVSLSGSGYHLELVTSHYSVAREVQTLLLDMELPCGFLERRGNFMLYYKDSGSIEDFLTAAGATGSAMDLMLRKVEKDLRNQVNRKVNCETANLEKTVEASAKQAEAICQLKASGRFDSLSDSLKQTAELRLENPELPLSELRMLFNPPLSRSGLNNRIKKLLSLAEE